MLAVLVRANNDRVRRHAADRDAPNPRCLEEVRWSEDLVSAWPAVRREWDAFVRAGGRLPRIEDLIAEDQGNEGPWRAGLLVRRGRPATALARSFPRTVAELARVPGIWSALWSVMEPGTELPTHAGGNAGVLRYHLGVVCPPGAALEVRGEVFPYVEGEGILFDDTEPHSAWNRSSTPRVTLFLELIRPVGLPYGGLNRVVQRLLALDPRYRLAPGRADAWHAALNPRLGDPVTT